jgi:hypothetical protein
MIRDQACRLLAEIAVGFLLRTLKEFSGGRGFSEKPGFSLELSHPHAHFPAFSYSTS